MNYKPNNQMHVVRDGGEGEGGKEYTLRGEDIHVLNEDSALEVEEGDVVLAVFEPAVGNPPSGCEKREGKRRKARRAPLTSSLF
jgi:hypothetical protein